MIVFLTKSFTGRLFHSHSPVKLLLPICVCPKITRHLILQ